MAGDRVLTVKIAGDPTGATRAIGAVEGKTVGLGKKLLKIGGMFAGLNIAKNVVGDMARVGMEYEKTMNTLQATTRATDEQMGEVGKAARELGSDMSIPATSASQATSAILELVKGGLSLDQAMEAARGSLMLAAAAQVDGGRAAEIQANAISQFNLEGKDASMVADTLANVADAATGSIDDVALALSYVGPVAASVSMEIDDTSTAIGLLHKNAIVGSKAGTALRAVIAGLASPSIKAQGALEDLGIEMFDAQGNFKGMRSLTDQLADAKKRLTEEEFAAAAAAAFGREPLAAINSLANEGVEGWDKMTKAVGREGSAAEVAAAKNEGFGGAMDALGGQMEDLYITIWEKVSPGLEKMARKAADAVGWVSDLANGSGDLSETLSNFDGTKAGEAIASAVSTALDKIGSMGGKIAEKIGSVLAGIDWVKLGIEAGKMIIPLVVGLIAGFINSITDPEMWKQLAKNWKPILMALLGIMFMPAKWAAGIGKAVAKIPFVGKFLSWAVKGLNKIGKNFQKGAKKVWDKFVKGFKDAIGWSGPGVIARVIKFFVGLGKSIAAKGKELAGKMGEIAQNMAERLGRLLGNLGPKQALAALRKLKDKILGYLKSAGSWLWQAGDDLIGGFLRGIMEKFGAVKDKLSELTKLLPDWKGPPEKDKTILSGAGRLVMDGFTDGLESRFGSVRSTLAGFTSDLDKAATDAVRQKGRGSRLSAARSAIGLPAQGGYVRGSQGGSMTVVHVTVEGNVIGEQDFARRVVPTIRKELSKTGDRNGGRIFRTGRKP